MVDSQMAAIQSAPKWSIREVLHEHLPRGRKVGKPLGILPHVQEQNKRSYLLPYAKLHCVKSGN